VLFWLRKGPLHTAGTRVQQNKPTDATDLSVALEFERVKLMIREPQRLFPNLPHEAVRGIGVDASSVVKG